MMRFPSVVSTGILSPRTFTCPCSGCTAATVVRGLSIDSRNRPLPAVAFPFGALIVLVGQTNPQVPALDSEVQVKALPTGFETHPPMIVRHLLQMNGSASRNNLVKRWPSIRQLALRSNLQ